jgi:nanoRNase/pAp phosphatase (c-di-AMP/oligoRNAs hydrolase)
MNRDRYKLREASLSESEASLVTSTKAQQFEAILKAHQGEHHIIALQSFPDPDAISSALAHQMIAERFEIECDITYNGVISHPENIALVELLDISLTKINEQDDLSKYKGSVFIDTQGTTTGLIERLAEARVPVVAIVDHHEVQGVIEAEYTDIRNVGATATIYAEYLESGLLQLDGTDLNHVRLATALMHGIRSETSGMLRAQREDCLAAAYLADFVDHSILATILSNERTRNSMDVIKSALGTRVLRDNYSIAGVGYLRYEDRDAIPQAADFLLTEENVHTAIVYGIVIMPGDREAIIGSLRTKKATLNPDTFLKEALGGQTPGRYYGGGRRGAGGFEIPVGFLAGSYDDDFMNRKWRLYDDQIRRKLLIKIGVQSLHQAPDE